MPVTYWDRGHGIRIDDRDILQAWPLHHNHRPQYRLWRTPGTITYADTILFARGAEGNVWLLRAVSMAGDEDFVPISPDRAAAWLRMDGHELPEELLYHHEPTENQPAALPLRAEAAARPSPPPSGNRTALHPALPPSIPDAAVRPATKGTVEPVALGGPDDKVFVWGKEKGPSTSRTVPRYQGSCGSQCQGKAALQGCPLRGHQG